MARPGHILSILAAVAGCAHPIGDALERAEAGQRPPPEALEVVYEEREGPLGGRRIVVRGDGTLRLERWRPGFVRAAEQPEAALRASETASDALAERRELRLRPDELQRLVRTLVAIEAWSHEGGDDPLSAPIEGGRAILRMRLGDATSEAWEYARDMEANDRLVRVRRVLDELLLARRGAP